MCCFRRGLFQAVKEAGKTGSKRGRVFERKSVQTRRRPREEEDGGAGVQTLTSSPRESWHRAGCSSDYSEAVISHKVFFKSCRRSQLPRKFGNLFFIIVMYNKH